MVRWTRLEVIWFLVFCSKSWAIRGERRRRSSEDARDHRNLGKHTHDQYAYYQYSIGLGGVGKQKDIPEVPSSSPSQSNVPSPTPSELPSNLPSMTASSLPSEIPSTSTPPSFSSMPSATPTISKAPSLSIQPSTTPSVPPTYTIGPSQVPSVLPSAAAIPSASTVPTLSVQPSLTPSHPTAAPSYTPSTSFPSSNPTTSFPSSTPTASPSTGAPSSAPSDYPYNYNEVSVVYVNPNRLNWPKASQWRDELESLLSPNAQLIDHLTTTTSSCGSTTGETVVYDGQGVCMMLPNCTYQFCNVNGKRKSNRPAYTVMVMTEQDISVALQFANRYNIPVTVKTTGHNFAGSSISKDSLNIWMSHFPKDGTIQTDFQDSCGTAFGTVLGVNGGELWKDVLEHVGQDHHIVTGYTKSVSAAGGWLQGVGLSYTSRSYGLGIDNVVSFDVVLADGKVVTADACSHPDLFWALRGGGGGTYGVVTHVEYKLHPPTEISYIYVGVDWEKPGTMRKWLEWWAQKSPYLDNKVCGAWWSAYLATIYVAGDENTPQAKSLFEELQAYFTQNNLGEVKIWSYPSWYERMSLDPDFPLWDSLDPAASARIIPRDMVLQDPDGVVNLLMELIETYDDWWGGYWLGGAVNDVDKDATAVHPAMRESLWALTVSTPDGKRRMRQVFHDGVSGVSFNHQGASEPNWRRALWGDDHYRRLLGIKNRYDPDRRFNCWHCVGYQGPEYADS